MNTIYSRLSNLNKNYRPMSEGQPQTKEHCIHNLYQWEYYCYHMMCINQTGLCYMFHIYSNIIKYKPFKLLRWYYNKGNHQNMFHNKCH